MTRRFLLATSILMLAIVSSADAQSFDEIERYRLNMEDVRRLAQANRNLDQAVRGNPALAADRGQIQSAFSVASIIKRNPALVKAVQDAGLAPERFAMIKDILWHTRGVVIMRDRAMAEQYRKNFLIHPDNVQFYAQNRAQIEALVR